MNRLCVAPYFHEYYTKRGNKTLRGYSVPFDLRRMNTELWVTNPHNGWEVTTRDGSRSVRRSGLSRRCV